jgi:NADPH:quinone reductase-like Zn-dependent oxidoreductase
MKAAFIERHGGPDVLEFGEMPDPVAGPGEVVALRPHVGRDRPHLERIVALVAT